MNLNDFGMVIFLSCLMVIGLIASADGRDGIIEDESKTIILLLLCIVMGIGVFKLIRYFDDVEKELKENG